jgi:hypothetical protein
VLTSLLLTTLQARQAADTARSRGSQNCNRVKENGACPERRGDLPRNGADLGATGVAPSIEG